MSNEFKKEDRYLVIKRSDIKSALDAEMQQTLLYLAQKVDAERHSLGKSVLECVVVESDWPIYNDVWKMVEAIANGEPTEIEQLRKELEEVKQERENVSVKYGDAWFDGFLRAIQIQAEDGNLEEYQDHDIALLSEVAEANKLNKQSGE